MSPKASVGKIVHYRRDGRDCAFLITDVHDADNGEVTGAFFEPNGVQHTAERVRFSEEPQTGRWNWPIIYQLKRENERGT